MSCVAAKNLGRKLVSGSLGSSSSVPPGTCVASVPVDDVVWTCGDHVLGKDIGFLARAETSMFLAHSRKAEAIEDIRARIHGFWNVSIISKPGGLCSRPGSELTLFPGTVKKEP